MASSASSASAQTSRDPSLAARSMSGTAVSSTDSARGACQTQRSRMANAACSRMPSSRWVRRGRMRENTWGKKADQAGGGAARANWGGGGGG